MKRLLVSLNRSHPSAVLPKHAHVGDVGYDLVSVQHGRIDPGETVSIDTGWTVSNTWMVSHDHLDYDDDICQMEAFMKVEGRSGLALQSVFPIGGIIDMGYRGPLKVNLYNGRYDKPYDVHVGDRIGQLVIYRVAPIGEDVFDETATEPSQTARGTSGFGSTGR